MTKRYSPEQIAGRLREDYPNQSNSQARAHGQCTGMYRSSRLLVVAMRAGS